MPRVSVIVPAFNAAHLIEETLESVVAQTYGDWEVVVGDDCSDDDTGVRAAAVDPRVTVARTVKNLGPAGARNAALERASGDLVAFLDADDLWLPRYLERQVSRFEAESRRPGPPVGIVACDALLRSPGGDLPTTYLEQFRPPVSDITLERVLRRDCVYVSALVPRDAGDEVGWFAPELFGTEDHDLWIRILETGRRAVLNREVLGVYRLSAGSVSSNIRSQGRNNQLTYRRALDRGRLSPRETRVAKQELRYNRAMEAVAAAWLDRDLGQAARALPTVAWVAVSRPAHWRDWARVLRGGDSRAATSTG